MHIHAHPGIPHTLAYQRTSAQTFAHTPMHTPHIPADALNLINHMKLHVNGKMAEDR